MTEYVKSTNFTSKDSLASGNALKIIKGTEFDVEFNSIAVAVATKADLSGPVFIGVPTAPTASAGTNTAQLATTAFTTGAVSSAITTERTNTTTLTNKTISLSNNTVTGTKAQFNTACSDADFATLAGSETLTSKTLSLTDNTVTGTKAQFNTACSDADFSFLNDFTGSNQSLGTSGYQKLPGGLVVQWGTFDPITGTTSITFPIAFATICVNVFTMDRYNGDSGGGTQLTALNEAPSTTGAVFSTAGTPSLVYWLALGY